MSLVVAGPESAVAQGVILASAAAASRAHQHRLAVSRLLGAAVSLGSAVVKLPQLLTLLRTQSTVGLSLSMYSVELFSQSIAVLYHRANGFDPSTYGENLSLGAGNLAILACFARYNRDPRAVVSILFPLLLAPLTHFPGILAFLQSLSIPLNVFAKLPQILVNWHVVGVLRKQIQKAQMEGAQQQQQQPTVVSGVASDPSAMIQPITVVASVPSFLSPATAQRRLSSPTSTSQLSPVPFALNFLGSFSRLYTTMTQLQGDRLMLVGFLISCALNGGIVLQCMQISRLQRQWSEAREQRTKAV